MEIYPLGNYRIDFDPLWFILRTLKTDTLPVALGVFPAIFDDEVQGKLDPYLYRDLKESGIITENDEIDPLLCKAIEAGNISDRVFEARIFEGENYIPWCVTKRGNIHVVWWVEEVSVCIHIFEVIPDRDTQPADLLYMFFSQIIPETKPANIRPISYTQNAALAGDDELYLNLKAIGADQSTADLLAHLGPVNCKKWITALLSYPAERTLMGTRKKLSYLSDVLVVESDKGLIVRSQAYEADDRIVTTWNNGSPEAIKRAINNLFTFLPDNCSWFLQEELEDNYV